MTKYIRFTFKNEEPLKIADDSTSQSGQINALTYVSGAVLRGAVINSFVRTGEFDDLKSVLLSDDVSFLNAYIMRNGRELIPSPKGFYEDKTDNGDQAKEIQNMLKDGNIEPGCKRAALGKYCYFENGCICYSHVDMGSDMKINKGSRDRERTVFRNQYIKPGYLFSAYIALTGAALETSLPAKLKEKLMQMRENDTLILGGSRSFGYGKCRIEEIELSEEQPYAILFPHNPGAAQQKEELRDSAYMMLLSDTAMISRSGAPAGIDVDILREKLGLKHLELSFCSTSVVNRQGYNRTWQTWLPSAKMYEMGSVFKLTFSGEIISGAAAGKLAQNGIGIRTSEGFGRVVFFSADTYEKISKKKEIEPAPAVKASTGEKLSPEEMQTLQIAAKGYYRKLIDRAIDTYLAEHKNALGQFRLNSTQLGTIESIILANLYQGDAAFVKLDKYFANASDKDSRKRIQNDSAGRGGIAKYVSSLREREINEIFPSLPEYVMGLRYDEIMKTEEIARIKLEFVIKLIRYQNRGKAVG